LTDEIQQELKLCHEFPGKLEQIQRYIRQSIKSWIHPVYMIGASHPQSNYANFTGAGKYIDGLVDDATWKKNHYLAVPTQVPIIDTDHLVSIRNPLTLLATAFPYPNWMRDIRDLRKNFNDIWIDPYPLIMH
jgi:hypothetical protein